MKMDVPGSVADDFNKLYLAYRTDFIFIARSYVDDLAVAEDLVTDSFVTYWIKREEIPSDATPGGYIVGIVKKKCFEYLRNKQNQLRIQKKIYDTNYRMLHHQIMSLESCNPEKLHAGEVLEILETQLKRMPELTREIFISSRLEELSYKQIAEKYRIPVRKVTSEIQRALALLRESLKDYLSLLLIFLLFASNLIHRG